VTEGDDGDDDAGAGSAVLTDSWAVTGSAKPANSNPTNSANRRGPNCL